MEHKCPPLPAAVISLKKTLVKDQFGNQLKPLPLDSKIVTCLEAENHALRDKIVHLEKYATSLKNDLEEAVVDSENAYKTITKLEKLVFSVIN